MNLGAAPTKIFYRAKPVPSANLVFSETLKITEGILEMPTSQ